MTRGVVAIHRILPDGFPPDRAAEILSRDELDRAARFHFPTDRDSWMNWRAALRTILAPHLNCEPHQVPIQLTDLGKPFVAAPLHFNLTHCDDLALLAIATDGPVGIDLESRTRATDLLGCEETFCHPLEIAALPPHPAAHLLQIWTAKEAILKALGTGLSLAPDTVRIVFDATGAHAISDQPIAGMANQRLRFLTHPSLANHQAVLSAPRTASAIQWP